MDKDARLVAVMPNPALPRLRVAVMAMGLLMLLGCTAPPPEPKVLTADEAAARTVVPLTRPIALDKAGQVVDVEFELPPAAEGEVPVLMVGLRVWGEDAKTALANEKRITERDLPTQVHLYTVGSGGAVEVPLTYSQLDMRSDQKVGPDGSVPHTTAKGLVSGLRQAGLIEEKRVYIYRNFANWRPAVSGRYRLTIKLAEERPELAGLAAELVIGYPSRSK
ncbi:hypothetical protein ACI703_18250 [Isoptericola jiangsuensis]|uniref:hypothetical protein n=1 Tax=Isoptericola jiangsuensis TaxID=548579 RepID=UPI0038702747